MIGKGDGGLDLDICPGGRVPSRATAPDDCISTAV